MNLFGKILVVGLSLFGPPTSQAQQRDTTNAATRFRPPAERTIDILAGGQLGRYCYLELGLAKRLDGIAGHHPFTQVVFVGVEGLVGPERIFAPKVGAWIGGGVGGMCLGINALYYTNGNESDPCLRPEIGLGFGPFKAVYGYNIKSTNLDRVNRHVFALALLFPVKHLASRRKDVF